MKYNSFSLLIVVLALLVQFGGCSKSADPAPSLVGTWRASTYLTSNCTNISNNVAQASCTLGAACPTIVITATTITSDTGVVGYTVTGNTLTVDGTSTIKSGTFILTATALTLTFPLGSNYAGCLNTITYIRV